MPTLPVLICHMVEKNGLQMAFEGTNITLCFRGLVHDLHVVRHCRLAAHSVVALFTLQFGPSKKLLSFVEAKDIFLVVVQSVPEIIINVKLKVDLSNRNTYLVVNAVLGSLQ